MQQRDGYKKTEKKNRNIEDEVVCNGYKETEGDGCKETKMRQDGVQQGDGCEQTEGRNRKTVYTRKTNPSTGSKKLDH